MCITRCVIPISAIRIKDLNVYWLSEYYCMCTEEVMCNSGLENQLAIMIYDTSNQSSICKNLGSTQPVKWEESRYQCDRFASWLVEIYVNFIKSSLRIHKRLLVTLWQSFMANDHFCSVQSQPYFLGSADFPNCPKISVSHLCYSNSVVSYYCGQITVQLVMRTGRCAYVRTTERHWVTAGDRTRHLFSVSWKTAFSVSGIRVRRWVKAGYRSIHTGRYPRLTPDHRERRRMLEHRHQTRTIRTGLNLMFGDTNLYFYNVYHQKFSRKSCTTRY